MIRTTQCTGPFVRVGESLLVVYDNIQSRSEQPEQMETFYSGKSISTLECYVSAFEFNSKQCCMHLFKCIL